MGKKKTKLFLSFCILTLCLGVLCYGVYAATNIQYTLSGHISYDVADSVFVDVDTTLYASSESTLLDSKANLAQNMQDIVTKLEQDDTVSSVNLAKQTYTDHQSTYNNGNGNAIEGAAQFEGSPLDLTFAPYELNVSSYAYYIAITISNYGQNSLYALLDIDSLYSENSNVIVTPYNTMQNIPARQGEEPSIKTFVFGLVLNSSAMPVDFTFDNVNLTIDKGSLDDIAQTNDFTYIFDEEKDGYLISEYNGSNTSKVIVPSKYNGSNGEQQVVGFADGQRLTTSIFKQSTVLSEIYLPETISYIGDYTFARCSNLRYINLPETVRYLGTNLLYQCASLSYIKFPDQLDVIQNVCCNNTNLISVLFPKVNKFLGTGTFGSCKNLVSVDIAEGNTRLSEGMFVACTGLTYVNLPDTIEYIGVSFAGNIPFLQNIIENQNGIYTTESGTKYLLKAQNVATTFDLEPYSAIAGQAFRDCTTLKNIIIPDNIKNITTGTFSGCTSLESVEVGNGVEILSLSAFAGCTNLVDVELGNNIIVLTGTIRDCPWYENQNGITLSKDGSTKYVIKVDTTQTTFDLSGVRAIARAAFSSCDSLTSITIPSNVIGIGVNAFNSGVSVTFEDKTSSWEVYGGDGFTSYVGTILGSELSNEVYQEYRTNLWLKNI